MCVQIFYLPIDLQPMAIISTSCVPWLRACTVDPRLRACTVDPRLRVLLNQPVPVRKLLVPSLRLEVFCNKLHYTVQQERCISQYSIALHDTSPNCITPQRTTVHYTVHGCIKLHLTSLHCITQCSQTLHCTVMHK